jgi:hypothetical protein
VTRATSRWPPPIWIASYGMPRNSLPRRIRSPRPSCAPPFQ